MLENLEKIKIETPVDKIIKQIRLLINSGQIKPGEILLPERKLAEHLGVGRKYVLDAISKLVFYGNLKEMSQSTTVIAGLSKISLRQQEVLLQHNRPGNNAELDIRVKGVFSRCSKKNLQRRF